MNKLTKRMKITLVFYFISLIGLILTLCKPEWSLSSWIFSGSLAIGSGLLGAELKEQNSKKFKKFRRILICVVTLLLFFCIGLLIFSLTL